jgi:hypothetical protein
MEQERFAQLARVMEAGFNTLADLQRETNARLDQTNARLDVHEKALTALVGEVRALNQRFDNFLTGAHRQAHEELEARVDRIEAHLGFPKAS